jgi:hypothetical protein
VLAAVNEVDHLLYSTDAGEGWQSVGVSAFGAISQIFLPSDTVVYARSTSGVIRTSLPFKSGAVFHTERLVHFDTSVSGEEVLKSLQIYNIGNDTLRLLDFATDAILKVQIEDSVIAPGDSTAVQVRYSTTSLQRVLSEIDVSTNSSFGIETIKVTFVAKAAASVVRGDDQTPPVKLFPNPAIDRLNVLGAIPGSHYTIYNMLGAKVKSGVIPETNDINITALKPAMYRLALSNPTEHAISFVVY